MRRHTITEQEGWKWKPYEDYKPCESYNFVIKLMISGISPHGWSAMRSVEVLFAYSLENGWMNGPVVADMRRHEAHVMLL